MADNTAPNRTSSKDKAEGDRSTAERDYDRNDGDGAGGITNRPLEEEIANQEAVPDRGHNKEGQR